MFEAHELAMSGTIYHSTPPIVELKIREEGPILPFSLIFSDFTMSISY